MPSTAEIKRLIKEQNIYNYLNILKDIQQMNLIIFRKINYFLPKYPTYKYSISGKINLSSIVLSLHPWLSTHHGHSNIHLIQGCKEKYLEYYFFIKKTFKSLKHCDARGIASDVLLPLLIFASCNSPYSVFKN